MSAPVTLSWEPPPPPPPAPPGVGELAALDPAPDGWLAPHAVSATAAQATAKTFFMCDLLLVTACIAATKMWRAQDAAGSTVTVKRARTRRNAASTGSPIRATSSASPAARKVSYASDVVR